MAEHRVRKGECISSIACLYGMFPDIIWDDPKNSVLKDKRKDPNLLHPGDIVHVRDKEKKQESISTDQRHQFRRKGIPKILKIQFKNVDVPHKNTDCSINIDGKHMEKATDGEGWLHIPIPPYAKTAKIRIDGEEYLLSLGHLDPVDEVSGIQGRLKNLNFYSGPIDGQLNDETSQALTRFQMFNNLEVSGQIDDNTKKQLEKFTTE